MAKISPAELHCQILRNSFLFKSILHFLSSDSPHTILVTGSPGELEGLAASHNKQVRPNRKSHAGVKSEGTFNLIKPLVC